MKTITTSLYRLITTIWAAAVWFPAFVAAPVIFNILTTDKQLAGQIAGALFHSSGYIGIACAILLLGLLIFLEPSKKLFREKLFYIIIFTLILVACNLFLLQPELLRLSTSVTMQSDSHLSIKQIHAIASGIHLGISLLLGYLVIHSLPVKTG